MEWLQQNWTTVLISVVLLLLVFKGIILGKLFGIKSMDVQELNKRIQQTPNSILLIDVRTPQEFKSGHIKGAKSMPLGQISQQLNSIPDDQRHLPVAVICASGSRSMMGATRIKKAGFKTIFNVSGGMMAWERSRFPITH